MPTRLLSPLLSPIGCVSNLATLFAPSDRPSAKTGAHRIFPASEELPSGQPVTCFTAGYFRLLRPNGRKAELALMKVTVQVVEMPATRFVLIELSLVLVGGKE